MPLKNEFDNKSYWIVLVRSLTGTVIGSVPGIIYILSTEQNIKANPFGASLVQVGMVIGTLAFGLATLASTIVAAIKYRGAGAVKPNRLKEYLNPDTLPTIPPVNKQLSKSSEQTEVRQTPLTPLAREAQPAVASQPSSTPLQDHREAQPGFEDYDR